jgi:hypothetical protein
MANEYARRKKLEDDVSRIGKGIGDRLAPGIGFTLLFFEFGEQKQLAYISNAQRDDMIKVLRQMADEIEAGAAGSIYRS